MGMPRREHAPIGHPTWIDLFSSDTAASLTFYGELFGWSATDPSAEHGGYVNFLKDGEPIAGMMGNDGSSGQPDTWSLHLAVEDAAKTIEAAEANGATVIVPAMPVGDLGWMSVDADPGGAAIGGWQPGAHEGFLQLAEPNTPGWFELHTREYDKSVAFYREVFGWDAQTMSDTADFRYTTLGKDEAAAAGIMDASAFLAEGAPAAWSVYFSCADTDATLARAVELGGTVLEPAQDTPYGRLAHVADPTGARFKLTAS
jgi:predicted enzyme related to lactoylglutathione lyase